MGRCFNSKQTVRPRLISARARVICWLEIANPSGKFTSRFEEQKKFIADA
jgi:hypothetical protein